MDGMDLLGYDEIGFGFFKKVGKAIGKGAGSAFKAARSVSRNPFVRAAAGGAAFVFPPAGAAVTGLVIADRVISAAESGGEAANTAKRVMTRTVQLARQGDSDARNAITVLRKVKKMPPSMRMAIRGPKFRVTARGRIVREL